MNNKFSFYTLPKSDVINDSEFEENEQTYDSNVENISIYTLDDDTFIEEYSFDNGDCNLYCDAGNDTLELLYSASNNDSVTSIYVPDGIYIAKNIDSKNGKIFYLEKNDFLSIQESNINSSITLHKLFKVINFVYDNGIVNKKMYDEFTKLNIKYSTVTKYIPASSIIDSTIDKVTHYIATRELNKDELINDYSKLQNFQELCYDSIYRISDFITNPSNTDLRKLSDSLQKNSTNISNLMDLYLVDDYMYENEER